MQNIELSDGFPSVNLPARKTKIPNGNSRYLYSKYGRECITCKKFKKWCEYTIDKNGINNKNPRCKECDSIRKKKFLVENREKIRKQKSFYRIINEDIIRERSIRYRRSPKGRLINRRRSHKRRARLRTAKTEYYSYLEQLTKFAYVNVLLFGDHKNKISKCPYCKRELKLDNVTLDHFRPLSKGGNNTLANLISCCKLCNSSKNARDPHKFLRSTKLTIRDQILIKSCARDTWVTDSLQYVELLNEIIEDLEAGLYD